VAFVASKADFPPRRGLVNSSLISRAQAKNCDTRQQDVSMRILRMDRRLTGAALATAFCLVIPAQQQIARRVHIPAEPVSPAPSHAPFANPQSSATPSASDAAQGDGAWSAPDPSKFAGAAPDSETRAAQAAALGYDLAGASDALRPGAFAPGEFVRALAQPCDRPVGMGADEGGDARKARLARM
jgi:hypothetical protein